jgi:hypothetical protein
VKSQTSVPASSRTKYAPAPTLEGAVRTSELRWLLEVRQRIGMAVEVLDPGLRPVLPALTGGAASVARRLLAPPLSEPIRQLARECLEQAAPRSSETADVRAVVAPIVRGETAAGVAVVAARARDEVPAWKLEQVAGWFADGIAAQLSARASAPSAEIRWLAALHRVLADAIRDGSEHEIVRRFADALAVWTDIEIRGYVAALDGRYVLDVALPGSDPVAAPSVFERPPEGLGAAPRRLASADRERLGFRGSDDVLVSVTGPADGGGWMIVASRGEPIDGESVLQPYLDALGHAIAQRRGIETARLSWGLTQHLAGAAASEAALGAAAAAIAASLDMAVRLAVRGPGGFAFSAGEATLDGGTSGVLTVPVPAPPGYTAGLLARRHGGRVVTEGDRARLRAAATTLGAALPAALRGLPHPPAERRAAPRTFEDLIALQTEIASGRGDPLSLLVIRPPEAVLSSDHAHWWIGRLRNQLRPSDLVGRLASGAVGVLLLQTPYEAACLVGERLRALVGGEAAAPPRIESSRLVPRGSFGV